MHTDGNHLEKIWGIFQLADVHENIKFSTMKKYQEYQVKQKLSEAFVLPFH